MDTSFYIVIIVLFIPLFLRTVYINKKASSRVFHFEYGLEKKEFKWSWKIFILPISLFTLSFIKGVDVGMLFFSTTFSLAILFDILQAKKPKHKSYLIIGTKLIYNGWKVKEFDLKELESVRFLPFRDSLKFIFKANKSIVIPRSLFDKNMLSNFIKKALQLSTQNVDIEEDAKNKIYF